MCLCSNMHHVSLFVKAGPWLDSQKQPPHDPRLKRGSGSVMAIIPRAPCTLAYMEHTRHTVMR